jgi:hypothetical protein
LPVFGTFIIREFVAVIFQVIFNRLEISLFFGYSLLKLLLRHAAESRSLKAVEPIGLVVTVGDVDSIPGMG